MQKKKKTSPLFKLEEKRTKKQFFPHFAARKCSRQLNSIVIGKNNVVWRFARLLKSSLSPWSVSGWGKKKKKGGSSLLLEEEEGVCVRVGVERRFFVCVRRLYV